MLESIQRTPRNRSDYSTENNGVNFPFRRIRPGKLSQDNIKCSNEEDVAPLRRFPLHRRERMQQFRPENTFNVGVSSRHGERGERETYYSEKQRFRTKVAMEKASTKVDNNLLGEASGPKSSSTVDWVAGSISSSTTSSGTTTT